MVESLDLPSPVHIVNMILVMILKLILTVQKCHKIHQMMKFKSVQFERMHIKKDSIQYIKCSSSDEISKMKVLIFLLHTVSIF